MNLRVLLNQYKFPQHRTCNNIAASFSLLNSERPCDYCLFETYYSFPKKYFISLSKEDGKKIVENNHTHTHTQMIHIILRVVVEMCETESIFLFYNI